MLGRAPLPDRRRAVRPVARTQAADYDQRREAIIEQAGRLFARTGFRGASVADLAAACATSKSLVYHYFPSKEDILYEVMASHIDQLVASADAALAAPGSARERLERLIHAFMRDYVGAAERQKVLLNELDCLPADKRAIIVTKQRRLIADLQALLVELDPDLGSSPARARVETMLVFGMINWTHTWFDPAGAIGTEALAEMVLGRLPGGEQHQHRPAS